MAASMTAAHGISLSRCQANVASSRLVSAVPTVPVCRSRQTTVVARAEGRSNGDSFLAGFVVGGVVFGALGFLFAPQLSKALLGDDQRLKLPRFLEEEEKDPEQTKQDLIEKINQLNASIDEVASQLKAKEESLPSGGDSLKIGTA
mmetsp:Transcript_16459/g.35579  ORF Transcript_16459/g.35579 Transcript_16459/m.35579 type:complete len:146 (-) Transcript_16459:698-1135(-)